MVFKITIIFKALIDTCMLESERVIVADLYKTGERGDYVDYRRFCHDMEKCDVRHNMEMDPLAPPVDYKVFNFCQNPYIFD